MTSVPLGVGAYDRRYGQEPEIQLLNRFFEQTPTNQVEQFVLLARPGNSLLHAARSGKIRWLGSQPGAFDGDLFYIAGETLFRWDGTNPPTQISGIVQDFGTPSATFVTGAGYEHLFIADGNTLQYYDGISAATGTLTASGAISESETVRLDNTFYEFVTMDVDTGSPDGTQANPWRVLLGADTEATLTNLLNAINATGVAGTVYSTALTAHPSVEAVTSDATTLNVRARMRGDQGNLIVSQETGANLAWGASTLEGGGFEGLNGVTVPDDQSVISLATLNSFVVVVITNSQRFYWVRPGEVTIDALDFATAESEPDELISVIRVGDALYMLGLSSTEVWYSNQSTAQDAPAFLRQQGLAFSQGTLSGTAVSIRNRLIVVAEDGIVYEVTGAPTRISNNGVEERIRVARAAENQGM